MSDLKKCEVGEVQVSFVGEDPKLRDGDYRYAPSKGAFLELIVDGQNFRVDIGDVQMPDGTTRRGLSIFHPCCDVDNSAINFSSYALRPKAEVTQPIIKTVYP